MADEREVLVEVKNLEVTYGSGRKAYKAVKNANFTIYKGETFGLVGESGSGKTTIGRAIIRIHPTAGGKILFDGKQINGVKFITARYAEGYGLIYDQTENGGRFLVANLDYSTSEADSGERAGNITEFPDDSGMSGITDYEFIDGWFIKNANVMA